MKVSFYVKINSFCNIFELNRTILPCYKRKEEKNRGFVDSEFVKTCHEHVINFLAQRREKVRQQIRQNIGDDFIFFSGCRNSSCSTSY